MQWLMRFWVVRSIHKSYGFHPVSQHMPFQSLSGPGAPRWTDHDRPKEFNFAKDVVDYWAQMEKVSFLVLHSGIMAGGLSEHYGLPGINMLNWPQEGKREPHPAFWWVNNQGNEIKWTFRELAELTRRAANVITQTCGLRQGDRLALILPRVPEWWLVTVGCIRSGIIFMPGTTQLKAKDILYRLQASEAQGIVTVDTLVPEVDSVASKCPALKTKLLVSDHSREGWHDFRSLMKEASPDHTCIKSKITDPMTIFFTSGTTGFPKMAKHDQGLAFRTSLPSWKLLQLKMSDVLWCMSDPGWILAVVGALLEPWTAGCTLFIHQLPQFEPKVIIQTLLKYPITQTFAAPTVYRMILQQDSASLKFPTLEYCATGGESLLPEEQAKWREKTGVEIHQIYGQSETGVCCGVCREMKSKPGSMGKAILPYDVQIIDNKGNLLPPNTEGNIGIRIKPTRPFGIFMCYENDPVKTAEVECGDFYNTGDRATIDEEGYFWFLGRADDVINASGYRIGPTEVENALAEHPAVAESAVVGSLDSKRGEVVKAFIVLTPEFMNCDQKKLTKELQEHVKSVTAPYKYPRKVEFVQELPKSVTGKIKRSDLRKKELGQI